MAELVVDSSVWVASFLPQDHWHHQASRFFDEVHSQRHICHIPGIVIVETCGALARIATFLEAQVAKAKMLEWAQTGTVRIHYPDSEETEEAVDTAIRHRLKGADAMVVALAERLGIPLRTYDNEILQRYGNAVQ